MMILESAVTCEYLSELAAHYYGDMVKAVADVDRGLIAVDAELHADLERILLEDGSQQESLWGFNIYPDCDGDDFIEFDSLINIRPRQNNMSRDVEDESVRAAIKEVVDKYVTR